MGHRRLPAIEYIWYHSGNHPAAGLREIRPRGIAQAWDAGLPVERPEDRPQAPVERPVAVEGRDRPFKSRWLCCLTCTQGVQPHGYAAGAIRPPTSLPSPLSVYG